MSREEMRRDNTSSWTRLSRNLESRLVSGLVSRNFASSGLVFDSKNVCICQNMLDVVKTIKNYLQICLETSKNIMYIKNTKSINKAFLLQLSSKN